MAASALKQFYTGTVNTNVPVFAQFDGIPEE